jgi:hypothetical protein
MSMALFCRPPVKGGSEPKASGGSVFEIENPPALRATPLIRGAKTK